MHAKKKPSNNKNTRKKVSKKQQDVISTKHLRSPAVDIAAGILISETNDKRRMSPLSDKMISNTDMSSIIKEPGDHEQDDEMEETFNPPLHSTAVYAEGEEVLDKEESPKQLSPNKQPHAHTVSKALEKSAQSPAQSSPDNSAEKNTIVEKLQKTPKKLVSPEEETESSSDIIESPVQMVSEEANRQDSSSSSSSEKESSTFKATDKANKSRQNVSGSMGSQVKDKSVGKKRNRSLTRKSKASGSNKTIPLKIWCTEDLPRQTRDLNELDIVLSEFEKIVTNYKQTVDSALCNKAIDRFYKSLKEEITTSIENAQKLKNLKRQNAKMEQEIGKKRKRLIEVRDELIENEPKLKQLQQECSKLQEKQLSLNNAREFLTNLKELQGNYLKYKKENPNLKESYGISSLPALLLQSQTVLRAEKHLHHINSKLQGFIDQRKDES
ncbi:centromere protein U isoform 2-T2 [Discoglossus pictus]